jgi:hypothetical protein
MSSPVLVVVVVVDDSSAVVVVASVAAAEEEGMVVAHMVAAVGREGYYQMVVAVDEKDAPLPLLGDGADNYHLGSHHIAVDTLDMVVDSHRQSQKQHHHPEGQNHRSFVHLFMM